jgi:hypothetical protein
VRPGLVLDTTLCRSTSTVHEGESSSSLDHTACHGRFILSYWFQELSHDIGACLYFKSIPQFLKPTKVPYPAIWLVTAQFFDCRSVTHSSSTVVQSRTVLRLSFTHAQFFDCRSLTHSSSTGLHSRRVLRLSFTHAQFFDWRPLTHSSSTGVYTRTVLRLASTSRERPVSCFYSSSEVKSALSLPREKVEVLRIVTDGRPKAAAIEWCSPRSPFIVLGSRSYHFRVAEGLQIIIIFMCTETPTQLFVVGKVSAPATSEPVLVVTFAHVSG